MEDSCPSTPSKRRSHLRSLATVSLATISLATISLVFVIFFPTGAHAQNDFIRGDCNIDTRVDIVDVLWIIEIGFLDPFFPPCDAACDADGDGLLNAILDGVLLYASLFDGGTPVPPPFPDCGPDTTTGLSCDTYDCAASPPAPSDLYRLTLPDEVQGTGVVVEVPVTFDVETNWYATGWSYGVCHDDAALTLQSVGSSEFLDGLNDGDGPHFATLAIHDGGWISAVAPQSISGGGIDGEHVVAIAEYTVLGAPGSVTALEFCDSVGDPPVALAVSSVYYPTNSTPVTTSGSVTAVPSFRRGDADGDGVVHVLLDAIYLLAFGFQGGPAPPCDDAVDVDDSGTLNSLADGLALLTYGFLGGPPPAPPGIVCGADPTPDGLECEIYGDCP